MIENKLIINNNEKYAIKKAINYMLEKEHNFFYNGEHEQERVELLGILEKIQNL